MATKYRINGREVSLAEFQKDAKGIEPGKPPMVRPPGNWPMKSAAIGVAPEQSGELERHLRECGVPTHVDHDDGDVILDSPKHRRAVHRALGVRDNDAGYSDAS